MRLTYVADNATSPNWGCRATSFALRQVLSRKHQIVATIDRALLSSPLTADARIPGDSHWSVVKRFRRNRLRRMPVVGPLAFAAIDALGDYHAPTHDIDGDADRLWTLRDRSPKARRIVDALDRCDAIVVNGEGEMIFSTPARPTLLQTLAICSLAKRMGKPVHYVNGMISRDPGTAVNVETAATVSRVMADARFCVRDRHSLDVARELLTGIAPAYAPDALFGWSGLFHDVATLPFDQSRLTPAFDRTGTAMPAVCAGPYIAISGSSMSARNPALATERYTALAEALKAIGMPILLVATCIGDIFLTEVARRTGLPLLPVHAPIQAGAAVMANARLLVSGRWHPGIMASLGGTPGVFMGSNSHKTLSLQEQLGYEDPHEYSAFPEAADIAAMVEESRTRLAEGNATRQRIADAAARLAQESLSVLDSVG